MRRTLQLALLCALAASAAGAQEITLSLIEPSEFGLLVRAEVTGPKTAARTVLLFVDTGASYTHLDARFLDLPRAKRTLRTMTGAGETDLRVLEPVTLLFAERTFDLESLEVNLVAHRKLCSCDVAGVLGRDVLRRFASVTIDFEAGVLRLKAARTGAGRRSAGTVSEKVVSHFVICFAVVLADSKAHTDDKMPFH